MKVRDDKLLHSLDEALEEVRKYFVLPQYPMTIIIRRTKQGNFNVQKVEEGE